MTSLDEMATWLREEIEARLWRARGLAVHGGHSGAWIVTKNDEFDYTVHIRGEAEAVGADPVADIWREDAAEFIGDNDPQGVIARCGSELAILDLCERVIREDDGKHAACGAVDAWSGLAVAKITLRFLAASYRRQDGYQKEWAE